MRSPKWHKLLNAPFVLMWLLTLGVTATIGLAAVIRSSNFPAWRYTFYIDFPGIKQYLTDTGVGYDSLFQFAAWMLPAVAIGISALRTFLLLKDKGNETATPQPRGMRQVDTSTPATKPTIEQTQQTTDNVTKESRTQRTPTPDILGDILGGVSTSNDIRAQKERLLAAIRKEWSLNVSSNTRVAESYKDLESGKTRYIWYEEPGVAAKPLPLNSLEAVLRNKGWLFIFDDDDPIVEAAMSLKLTKELLDNKRNIPLTLSLVGYAQSNMNMAQWIAHALMSRYNVSSSYASTLVGTSTLAIIVNEFAIENPNTCKSFADIELLRSKQLVPFALVGVKSKGLCVRSGCQLKVYSTAIGYITAIDDPESEVAKAHHCLTLVADIAASVRTIS